MERMEEEDFVVEPGKEGDLRCGVGSCRPKTLQRCVNMKVFTIILAMQMLFHLSVFSYFFGVRRTVERRFGFTTKDTGVIDSASNVVQTVFVIFVGYLGAKMHKPRYLSVSFFFDGIGAMLLSLPYLIYGPLKDVSIALPLNTDDAEMMGMQPAINYQVCDAVTGNMSVDTCGGINGNPAMESNTAAYVIILMSFILMNLSGSAYFTMGIAFIDENLKKEDSGMYIGFAQSMFAIGPIVGFSLAAVTTKLPEDLTETSLSPTDPQFIGCWWLGGLILGSLMLVNSIPLFIFPKHLPDYYRYHRSSKKTTERSSRSGTNPVIHELKQFAQSLWKLISNPAAVLLVLSEVCIIYLVTGVMINIPRYIEIHFHKPAFVANIASAVSGALTGALGNLLGGFIMKKGKIQARGAARIYLMAILVTVAGLCVMLLMSCPQSPLQGQTSSQHTIEVANECNAACGCDRDTYQPVCSQDGAMYFSPCHAGCRNRINGTYSDCNCTAEVGSSVSGDFCENSCSLFIPYLATFMVIILLGNMASVPATILLFRVIEEDLKAFALGILSCLINILGFVPGTVMFGALFDSTCILWGRKCGKRGACLIYDISSFRYLMHGVTLGFEVLAALFSSALLFCVTRRFRGKEEPPAVSDEPEKDAMLELDDKPSDAVEG